MNQKVAISISAAAVAAAVATIVTLVQTCDITLRDVPADASPDAFQVPVVVTPDASTGARWGSLLSSCNLADTCESSIACENAHRYNFNCQYSCRTGLGHCALNAPQSPPSTTYTHHGSLVRECDELATCTESVACENRARANQSCQFTRLGSPVVLDAGLDAAQELPRSGRWGSIFPSCNLVNTCSLSIACENSMRMRVGMAQLPPIYTCP